MMDYLLPGYLLAGLIAHKLLWEVLKRKTGSKGATPSTPKTLRVQAVKTVKLAILLGLVVQVFLPDVLPITTDDTGVRTVGVIIYTLGWLAAVVSRLQLQANWTDIETPGVLESQSVVNRGLYRRIRHPIYVGDLLLLFGFELALNSWLVLGIVLLTPVVLRQAIQEEALLADRLPGYRDYCRTTKRFIPFLF